MVEPLKSHATQVTPLLHDVLRSFWPLGRAKIETSPSIVPVTKKLPDGWKAVDSTVLLWLSKSVWAPAVTSNTLHAQLILHMLNKTADNQSDIIMPYRQPAANEN